MTNIGGISESVNGRSFIVTGGGSGIGRATAIRLARAGASVIVADANGASADETTTIIITDGGVAVASQADISNEEDVERMVGEAVESFGGLDGAFNNAGISKAGRWTFGTATSGTDAEDWRRVIDVNLTGAFLCLKHELRALSSQSRGSIVVNASAAGLVGVRGVAAYAAAKHGVIGLVKSAALEVAESGIRVNAVCPAYTATPMVTNDSTDESLRVRAEAVPLKRLGQPEEIADVVLWLLSDASSFVTGSAVPVDGGMTAG